MTKLELSPILSPEDRFALNVTARLTQGSVDLPHDISERLRIARMQAVTKRKVVARTAGSMVNQGGGTAAMTFGGNDNPGWWTRFASALPLVALVAGLLTIYVVQDDNRVDELAEVDTALLADDLPTAAYTDPGFVEFLKTSLDTNHSNQ